MGNANIPMTGDDRQAPGRGGDIGPDMQAPVEIDDGRVTRIEGGLQRKRGRVGDRQAAASAACGQRRRKGYRERSRPQLHTASREPCFS